MIKAVTDISFKKDVLDENMPVVVDFWASWCGPCKMLSPVVDKISENYNGKVKFMKLNVDENPVTSNMYGVSSIPTLLLFKDGKALGKIVGFRPQNQIESAIDGALGL